ncbi:MAG: efflux RND transporter periplasmic adaptor subunit [Elusimicrobiota bacterium]
MFKKKKIFILGGGLIIILGFLTLWGVKKFSGKGPTPSVDEKNKLSADERIPVNLYRLKPVDFQDSLTVMGTIKGGTAIELKFQIEGRVTGFNFREGDHVGKGEVIARIDDSDAYLKLKQAELELDKAKRMYEAGGVTLYQLKQARLVAELAKSDYWKTFLPASREGIISKKNVEVGEYVSPTMTIALLSDISSVLVEVGIIEKDANKIFMDQKMVAFVDSYPEVEFSGTITDISPDFDELTRTLPVKTRIDNPDGLLLPGMFARAKIFVFEEAGILVVPVSSLESVESAYKTFVVGDDNIAVERLVEVGYISNDYAQIVSGLSEGEMVVNEKPENLKDGSIVEIVDIREYGQAGQPNQPEAGAEPVGPAEQPSLDGKGMQ